MPNFKTTRKSFVMDMGKNSDVSETAFKQKDQNKLNVMSGKSAGLYNKKSY